MTVLAEHPTTSLKFLSLELTSRCQLTCPGQCYAEAGPAQGHGDMTGQDWHRIIDEAVVLGTRTVQFIGGEPTLHPDFTELVEHALRVGLAVRIHSNLYRVRAEHWPLFEHPRVSVATTCHSDTAAEHDAITGRNGSHAATRASIVEAGRRGVKTRVAIVDHGNGQRVEQARAEMERLGVVATVDRVRAVGRARRRPPAVPVVAVRAVRRREGGRPARRSGVRLRARALPDRGQRPGRAEDTRVGAVRPGVGAGQGECAAPGLGRPVRAGLRAVGRQFVRGRLLRADGLTATDNEE
ncbi:radical SAM protein [Streptomyces sp. NPDC088557]|uniref:radical SAM protein n=1 Tax=Streptomyces sp. NPDC088557 TaxID=3365867 RepID=UPI0038094DD3